MGNEARRVFLLWSVQWCVLAIYGIAVGVGAVALLPLVVAEAGALPTVSQQSPEPGLEPKPESLPLQTAYLILLKGEVNGRLMSRVFKGLERATAVGAQVVIIEIDTFGGELDAAVQIRDALLDLPLQTIAFINKRAISAGALVALATHEIVMAPGATIGAATPLRVTWTGTELAGEKAISYFRKEMKTTAESREHPGELAEAMVDTDVVVPGVVEKGKLLTLTTREALDLKLAAAQHGSLEDLLAAFQFALPAESQAEAQRVTEQSTASRWWGQVRAWQGWLIAGLGLLVAEMMLPGFFLLWFGVGALLVSLLAYLGVQWGIQVGVFLGSSSLLLVFSRTIFRTKFLRSPQTVRTNVEALKGRPGIVLSPIEGSVKPGLVKVGGEKWSAVCEEETHITKGSRVEVLAVVGNKVRVKKI
jgi:membrane-bound ClpP family serine protease